MVRCISLETAVKKWNTGLADEFNNVKCQTLASLKSRVKFNWNVNDTNTALE